MKYDLSYNKTHNLVTVNSGLLKGYTFPLKHATHGFNLRCDDKSSEILMTTTDQALIFQDYLDTSMNFRQFVQKCLKENTKTKGLKNTLNMTGLSYTSYKNGINSDHQRKDSKFNKYLESLLGVHQVFNALHFEREERANPSAI